MRRIKPYGEMASVVTALLSITRGSQRHGSHGCARMIIKDRLAFPATISSRDAGFVVLFTTEERKRRREMSPVRASRRAVLTSVESV